MNRDVEKMIRELADVDTKGLNYFLPIDKLLVSADVELDGEALRWRSEAEPVSVSAPKDLLDQFIKLKDAEPESILRFARKWGRLSLCEHDLPCTHAWVPVFLSGRYKRQLALCFSLPFELLESWRTWAKKFNAVLNVTAQLNLGKHGDISQWRLVFEDTGWSGEEDYLGWGEGEEDLNKLYDGYWKLEGFSAERMWLMDIVNNYLDMGGVRPRLRTIDYRHEVIPSSISLAGHFHSSLFAVLAIQLMVVVSGTKTAAICTACGRTYSPKRRPKTGQANYCDEDTCQRIGRREATRRWRNKPEIQKKLERLKRSRKKLKETKHGKAGAK